MERQKMKSSEMRGKQTRMAETRKRKRRRRRRRRTKYKTNYGFQTRMTQMASG